jgi:uncharacterized phage protein (TIGR01671 family)
MREIKFRAWNHESRIMTEGLEISHLMKEESFVLANKSESYVWMQFTGLKDKNGVDIYEGDIVRIFGNNKGFFKVIFVNCYVGGWVLKHKDLDSVSLGARKESEIEVIGNIHQTPELL